MTGMWVHKVGHDDLGGNSRYYKHSLRSQSLRLIFNKIVNAISVQCLCFSKAVEMI